MLKGLNVFITGGDRGIGKAIVLHFAKNGANVYFSYNSNKEAAECTKNEALTFGTTIDYYQLNLKSAESIQSTSDKLLDDIKSLNILVNNAGYVDDVMFVKADFNKWYDVFSVTFRGAVSLTHKLLPNILMQEYGRIINISSIAGLTGIIGQTNYCSAKAALISFTKTLGRELARLDITVNAIAPGYINTDMTGSYTKEEKKAMRGSVPMNRFGEAKEVAEAALFLASNMSSYITSQVIVVDGGML